MAKQISVFLENRVGTLSEFAKTFADNNIEILAICVADTTDFGILRCIARNPEHTVKVLRENGFMASLTEVLAVRLEAGKVSMFDVFEVMTEGGINVEYMYSFTRSANENMAMIFKVSDMQKAQSVLEKKDIKTLTEKDWAEFHA